MVKIPKNVKVCGKTYRIDESKDIEDCGNLIPTDCRVIISTHMDRQQVRDTVLHELLHAIEFEMNLDTEERHIHVLATATLDMLRSNKDLVKFLLEKEGAEAP